MLMTNDELLSLYILARSLWWRHDLEQLDAEAVAAVIAALESAQRDVGASYVECEGCEMRVVGYRRRKNAIRIWNKTGRGVPCGLEI